MERISTTTTHLVELSNTEYEALRILSGRVKNHDVYAGGEQFYVALRAIIGQTYTNTIEKMFGEE